MMATDKGDFWSLSDNIEDIEADQPYGIISMIEYGMSELDTTAEKCDDLQFGYGRGIPIQAACSELAADIRQYNLKQNKMGELLTTEDILKLSLHDEDKVDSVPETAAMLRSVGINKYNDAKFTSYKNKESRKILSKPIVNGNGFPILLDDSFHKFDIKPKVLKTTDSDNATNSCIDNDNGGTITNIGHNLVTSDNQTGPSNTDNEVSTYIGFANIFSPNKSEKHTLRYKQPTIGIGREIFVKPSEVYFTHKAKQNKKTKSSAKLPSK